MPRVAARTSGDGATKAQGLLRLLQLADSALPVGGASHSFGFETLVEEGIAHPGNLEILLTGYLEEAGALEAVFVRRAWRSRGAFPLLAAFDDELSARRPARESREASIKMGRRLAELVNSMAGARTLPFPAALHYPLVFGAAGWALGVGDDDVVLGYLNQSLTGLVSAFQRLLPLGQLAAARILWNLKPALEAASQAEEVACFSPCLDLASMRHGQLETRLFIS